MRIFKHLRTDWFRYGFETLAVIVGILAAFALENWREERQSKDQTDIFLQHIESNIAEDLEELSTLMVHLDLTIKRAETLITSFKTATFDAYEASVNSGWMNVEKSFQVNRSGMDALINSGRLDLLSPNLAYDLQQYYALCDKLREREDISNSFIQERYEPYHFEHYLETTRLSEFGGIREKYLDDPREQFLISEEDIVDDYKLEILILIRLVHSEAEREIYHQLIDSSLELQASIRQILSGQKNKL